MSAPGKRIPRVSRQRAQALGQELHKFVRRVKTRQEDGSIRILPETKSFFYGAGRFHLSKSECAQLLETVTELIEQGADLTITTSKYTALEHAVWRGYWEVAELLLSSGAQPKKDMDWSKGEANEKWPLVTRAIRAQQMGQELLEVFESIVFDYEDKIKKTELFEKIKGLVDEGANLTVKNTSTERTALHYAVIAKSVEMVQCLVEHGADLNMQDKTNQKTALHYAITAANSVEMVQYLLERGAAMNKQDEDKKTPLHYAVTIAKSVEMVQYLVKHGADIYMEDKDKKTVLYYAAKQKYVEIVQYLLNNGADDVSSKNEQGKSHLDYLREANIDGILMKVDFDLATLTTNNYGIWFHLLNSDHFSKRVADCLSQHAAHVKKLAYSLDGSGRRAIDVATKCCKKALKDALFFLKRYDLDYHHEHMSATCMLYYAKDSQDNDRRVAVKLMSQRGSYEAETQGRSRFDKEVISCFLYKSVW
jgi:ankyrin repeat protein